MPQIQLIDDKMDFKIELSDIEKSNELGIFELRPSFPNGKPSTGTYCDVNYRSYISNSLAVKLGRVKPKAY